MAVLDLETTGLDVRRDRVVQAAVVTMLGARILETPRFVQLVNPGAPIPEAATRIHGIRDADVAGAPGFAQVAAELRGLIAGRVVVGHNIGFDLAVLRHEAARANLAWHDPPALDLAMLVGALEPRLPDLGLESVASLLGVGIEARHSALGDALAAAQVFARLLPRLREADVRTLGEAQALAARRGDLALRQGEAGWHARPGEPAEAPGAAPAPLDSTVFLRSVREVMQAPPVCIAPGSSLRAAARLMIEKRIGSLLVGEAGRPPRGILTERDLLRELSAGARDPDATRVEAAMSTPVACTSADERLYRALGRMDRLGVRHLCVVDAAGAGIGMVSQRDLLHHRARGIASLGDPAEIADGAGMAARFSRLPELAGRLLGEGLDGIEIARVISGEVRALTARAAEIVAARLEAEGRGAAPTAWCLLVLGSAARGESLLAADQDNALVHAGTAAHDDWFAAFGEGIAQLLDEGGIIRCKGGVMAANAAWRGSPGDWSQRVQAWLDRANPQDILNADIFFDFVPVAGNLALGRALHAAAVAQASHAAPFLNLLAQSVAGLVPPIGLFGRLRAEEGGRLDLKRGGLLPLTGMARTLALRIGAASRATPERLSDAVAAGRLTESDAETLRAIHARVMTLILRQQLRDLGEGVAPSGRVALKALAADETKRLALDLRRLDDTLPFLRRAVAG